MRIVMIGSGYVGLVSGACLADFGHEMICVFKSSQTIEALERGEVPIFEPGLEEIMDPGQNNFDIWDPANVSPLVAYLSTADCPFTGETFFIKGGVVKRVQTWEMADRIEKIGTWTVDELAEAMVPMASQPDLNPSID